MLNPALKVFVSAWFLIAFLLFFQCSKKYGGILRSVTLLLFVVSLAGLLSSLFRLSGDYFEQYKWGESILELILVIIVFITALRIRKKMNEISILFGECPEEK